jgi:hypothetical protein
VDVSSELGKGTTFRFYIQSSAVSTDEAAQELERLLQKTTILPIARQPLQILAAEDNLMCVPLLRCGPD